MVIIIVIIIHYFLFVNRYYKKFFHIIFWVIKMTRIIKFLIIISIFMFTSCSKKSTENIVPQINGENIRGVWVSVYDMDFLKNDEKNFSICAENMFKDIAEKGFNNVFLQVRPFSDALYNSEIFPWSSYLTGVQGQNPGFDPLKILIDKAHNYNLKLQAWINPYRILYENDITKISKDNPAYEMIQNKDDSVFICDSGIFYNPCSIKAQKLILDGIREIVKNYDVDGIHIDDYFYPVTTDDIDKNQFEKYDGNLSLDEWRMMNVNSFVSGMYSAVKAINKDTVVSISPSGNIESNYTSHFADVRKWLSEPGYADWIIPQIYFGFENEYSPFEKVLNEWKSLDKNENVSLVVGLALYKCSKPDENAGNGVNEWTENSDIIKRQIEMCDNLGFVLYSYPYTNSQEFINYSDLLKLSE